MIFSFFFLSTNVILLQSRLSNETKSESKSYMRLTKPKDINLQRGENSKAKTKNQKPKNKHVLNKANKTLENNN